MKTDERKKSWPLFRIIIPAFPRPNIYTRGAKMTTALGPIMVATAASKVWGFRVEVIDENNYRGPLDKQGLPDHHRLQQENPAFLAGFYCGLTSTIERVWRLAEFYKKSDCSINIAGGWHAFDCLKETLCHNIDIVVHNEGELKIKKLLEAIQNGLPLENIEGISFLSDGEIITVPESRSSVVDLNCLPFPDFGLLRWVGKLKIYPISRIRGCRMNCEFCRVRVKPHWASPEHLFETVNWLVETRRACCFLIVDDRLEEDMKGTIRFFELIAKKYGNSLWFMVQARLEAAQNSDFIKAMKKAGVSVVCIGYESPLDEDLRAMRKGYSVSSMLKHTKVWRKHFRVHAMFIAGYPKKENNEIKISPKEIVKNFKRFIRRAGFETIQILLPGPAPRTDLRRRLEREGRIFPLDVAPWRFYDGQFVLFKPKEMSVEELQRIPLKIMRWFYGPMGFVSLVLRTISMPFDCLIRGFRKWRESWLKDLIKYTGYRLIKKWRQAEEDHNFLTRIRNYGNYGK